MLDAETEDGLREFATEQIVEVIQVYLASHLHDRKDSQISKHLFWLSQHCGGLVILVSAGWYRQLVLENKWHSTAPSVFLKSISISIEVLLFLHSLYMVKEIIKRKLIKVSQFYATDTSIWVNVQVDAKV